MTPSTVLMLRVVAAASLLCISLGVQGCVASMAAGTIRGAGKVAGATVSATGDVAGAAIGSGRQEQVDGSR